MREGQPVQQPVKPAPVKAFHEVEGRPTWKPTMPATALAFPRGGGAHLRVQPVDTRTLQCGKSKLVRGKPPRGGA